MHHYLIFKPILAMTNGDTLIAIHRGYRLEKPNYPGDVTTQELNAIYAV